MLLELVEQAGMGPVAAEAVVDLIRPYKIYP
jgi:hypothetical protein